MDELTKRRVCELVAGVIATDEELPSAELRFLVKLLRRFGIAQGPECEVVRPTRVGSAAAALMAELPEAVRDETVQLLIDAVVADGKISPKEREYMVAIAEAVGMTSDEMCRRLEDRLARPGGPAD
jgi:uncharacterized tellurite resistance protein B-like protein